MATKRMFSLQVVDTDKFMDMPVSAQALYFHLGMHGDDDGFVSSPRKISRAAGCNDDDMRLLAAKGFIIPFDNGVVVITDWKINNTLKNDRYQETIFQTEKAMLHTEKSGKYTIGTNTEPPHFQLGTNTEPPHFQLGTNMEPQHNITEHSLGKQSIPESVADKPPSRHRFIPPTMEEVRAYCAEKGYNVDPQRFVDYYTSNGWRVGKNPMEDWKAAVRTWERNEKGKPARKGCNVFYEIAKEEGIV